MSDWITPTPPPPPSEQLPFDLPDTDAIIVDFTMQMVQGYNTYRDVISPFVWLGIIILIVILFVDVWQRWQNL